MGSPDVWDEITGEWDAAHDRKTDPDALAPVEMRFVLDVRDHPDDGATRMVYADWLEHHGDTEKAELVRLLDDPPAENTPRRARLRVLGADQPGEWMAVLSRGEIEKCDERFRFKCPRKWESLASTDAPDVRHCKHCERSVHFCATLDDVRANGLVGNCVAFSAALVRDHARHAYDTAGDELRNDEVMMGDISPDYVDQLFDD